ncbi:MAG: hypothetical protein MMC33_000337 [Icmadophila ericetorum]|nr:hypothetical protein [Icmadophila ericetorum]
MARMTIDDEMFHLRRPIPSEIPNIKNLVLPSFISGELGRDLTFGDLEFAEYLDWFLPRALDDEKALFYVLEFQPLSSFRSYPPRIIGCIYISLSEPLKSSYPFPGMSLLKLRMLNAIEDIKIWPNMHAAEVHKRLLEVHGKLAKSGQNTKSSSVGQVRFFMIQEQFRRAGLGSRMLSWACKSARERGLAQLDFVFNASTRAFSEQYGFAL